MQTSKKTQMATEKSNPDFWRNDCPILPCLNSEETPSTVSETQFVLLKDGSTG